MESACSRSALFAHNRGGCHTLTVLRTVVARHARVADVLPSSFRLAAMLPANLAYQLVHTLHLTNEEIAHLSLEEAVQRMTEYWAQPRGES